MELFHSLDHAAAKPALSVVTIGAFDGIHLAHQELLRLVRERAAQNSAASVAITFDPHPLRVLAPQKAPKLLTPAPIRLELIAASGIDRLLVLPFNRDFSLWSPEKFVEEVLGKALRAVAVVVGDNFRFGYRAAGDVAMLAELGKKWKFETHVLSAIHVRGKPVSSSQIRSLLEAGDVVRANRLLGHPFSVRHAVEPGLGIGRAKTVPTLNLGPYPEVLPTTGVYVTETKIIETRKAVTPREVEARNEVETQNGAEQRREAEAQKESETQKKSESANQLGAGSDAEVQKENNRASTPSRLLRSVTNVGYRPTFGDRALGVETHLLDPLEPHRVEQRPFEQRWSGPTPTIIEVRFLYRLRDERKFDSPEQLKAQILRDIHRTESYFRRLPRA